MRLLLLALALSAGAAVASEGIRVWVDGTRVQFFDAEPEMVRGRVMVPLRGVFQALGAEVTWNGATQTVVAWKDETRVELSVNNPRATVDGREVILDVPPVTRHDRVMVPLRFIGEAFGAHVRWEPETRSVLIQSFPPPGTKRLHSPVEWYVIGYIANRRHYEMIIAAISALIVLSVPAQGPAGPVCPIMGSPAKFDGVYTDYNGVRYAYCCPGCEAKFEKDPAQYLKSEANKGKLLGISLFDPVSKSRLDYKTAPGGFSDYNGTRYYFQTAANKRKFDAAPASFGKAPEKEALFCPVMESKIVGYSAASGYADHNGVRYYFCCAGCQQPFEKDPGSFAPKASAHVTAPKAIAGKKGEDAAGKACCAEKTAEEKAKCCGGGCQ